MPPPYWEIRKGSGGGTLLNNVTNVVMTKGRRVLSDNYASGYCTVIGKNPSTLPTLAIGDTVTCTLFNPNQSPTGTSAFTFRVADFRVVYGIRPNMDEWELVLEDAFSRLGRAIIDRDWPVGRGCFQEFESIVTSLGISYGVVANDFDKLMSAQTLVNQSALSIVQTITNTAQALLFATGDTITWYTQGWQRFTNFVNYSDAGGAATRYQQLNFFSMADNLANKVVVTVNGSPSATVGSGVYAYQIDTYARNATEATNIGGYVSGALSVQTQAPNQMTVVLNNETSSRTLSALANNSGVNITLRGTTYQATVIGFSISSDTTTTRVTLNLSSTAFYNFLILDNTLYGTLDNNRLGF